MNFDPHEHDLERLYELEDRVFGREPNRILAPRPRKRQFRHRDELSLLPAEAAIPEAA
jgi:hypothetical protein